ncbi:MAG: hypothetical protein BWY26_01056 [Elusimicrobia bacterium ADurb.Bin231]|nr:MAG: hypothetical protein BWY26_01056 [Elusimicrobia bacterium ADurb.Bin231]
MRRTSSSLILDYFKKFEGEEHYVGTVLDQVSKQYAKLYGRKPYDLIHAIMKLVQEGKITMVRDGVYMYNSKYKHSVSVAGCIV